MTIEDVQRRVAEITELARRCEGPEAHGREDLLYFDVLKAIAAGADNPAQLASEALRSSELQFDRWYE